jgi:hypothetical protein
MSPNCLRLLHDTKFSHSRRSSSHEDVEQLGAGSGAEGIEAIPELALLLVRPHCRRLAPPTHLSEGGQGQGRCKMLAPPLLGPQHADKHRSERPVLLAVDQQLGDKPGRGTERAVAWCRWPRSW